MSSSTVTPQNSTRRSLLLHDTLTFLALSGVTVALLIVTLLLFKSFEAHREELGVRWAGRGETALREGHPQQAVSALRTALTYRDSLQTELQLAQALANAGRIEEARNYFLTLRETRPGDGFINLQLARLTRRQGDAEEAVNYYRASIFGNWEGDGAQRRRDVRLELADYLAGRGEIADARDLLLIAAGNTPENAANDVLFGDHLLAIGATANALGFYTKALTLENPDQTSTLIKAGRLAYSLGQYDKANKLLTEALTRLKGRERDTAQAHELQALATNAHRVPELSLSRDLPATTRAAHILSAAHIAQGRLISCLPPALPVPTPTGTAPNGKPPAPTAPVLIDPTLATLRTRWAAVNPQLNQHSLAHDAELQDTVAALVNDTEQQTGPPCGAPQGDDALLLMLAKTPQQTH